MTWSVAMGMVLAMALAGVAYGGWRLVRAWRYRTALVEIREQVQAGRHGVAARNLAAVLAWEPGSDEAAYLLGVCEKARGRTEAGRGSLGPGPTRLSVRRPGDRWAGPPCWSIAGGSPTPSGSSRRALSDPRIDGFDLRRFLAPLYWQEGRVEEARRLVEANWEVLNRAGRGGSDQAIELVRLHIAVSVGTASAESVQALPGPRRAAGDPRTIGSGWGRPTWRSARARSTRRRGGSTPACSAVPRTSRSGGRGWTGPWRPVASRRPARRSTHLPAARVEPGARSTGWRPGSPPAAATSRPSGRPWSGSSRPTRPTEPHSTGWPSWRCSEGQPARAAELRGRKAALDPLKSQYKELFLRNQPVRDAAEMARTGGATGPLVRGQGLRSAWRLATEPARDDLRTALARLRAARQRAAPSRGQTLADALARELDDSAAPRSPVPLPLADPGARPLRSGSRTMPVRAGLIHVFDNGESPLHQMPEVHRAAGSACSTSTATAGSTSMPSRAGRSRPGRTGQRGGDRLFRNRGDGTFEDVTELAGPGRHAQAATATASRSATTTTTATPTCSSPAGGRMPSIATGATARSRT